MARKQKKLKDRPLRRKKAIERRKKALARRAAARMLYGQPPEKHFSQEAANAMASRAKLHDVLHAVFSRTNFPDDPDFEIEIK